MTETKLSQQVALSGVTPSGDSMHLGNYFGMIKPLLELSEKVGHVYCFVSDLHALTTVHEPSVLAHNIEQVVLNYLAFGVGEVKNLTFFRQSDVPEHSELMVILSNYVGLGQMKRMHAFKDKLQKGSDESSINMGLFNYPILMAADILLYDANVVPVGADQKQHVEITRDIAQQFNKETKTSTLVVPEPLISQATGKIIGTDGERKMSKSLGNIIGIFDDYSVIEKQIMRSFTDPSRLKATDPGKVEGNPIFIYHDLINEDQAEVEDLKKRYRAGQVGDVEVKRKLLAAHQRYFAEIRARKEYYEQQPAAVIEILAQGQAQASVKAKQVLAAVQKAVGLR